jgi:hypothetical protein
VRRPDRDGVVDLGRLNGAALERVAASYRLRRRRGWFRQENDADLLERVLAAAQSLNARGRAVGTCLDLDALARPRGILHTFLARVLGEPTRCTRGRTP